MFVFEGESPHFKLQDQPGSRMLTKVHFPWIPGQHQSGIHLLLRSFED
jgi:hypothetical protein